MKKTKRPIDSLVSESYGWFGTSYILLKKTEIKLWKAALIIAFVTGAAGALIWSVSFDFHDSSKAAGPSPVLTKDNNADKGDQKNAPNPKDSLSEKIAKIKPVFPEVGGTVYVDYTTNVYKWDGKNRPEETRTVIANYHKNPELIKEQLKKMYEMGQRQITLNLWYVESSKTDSSKRWPDNIFIHTVVPQNAALTKLHEKNLKDLLKNIKETGYQKIYFRFCTQGGASPNDWDKWEEKKYQNNWNFIVNVRSVIKSELGSSVPVIFDLDGEYGGSTTNQAATYTKRLWSDYVKKFGPSDSYGFSFAVTPGRVKEMIKIYDEVGTRPSMYALDVYGKIFGLPSEYEQLRSPAQELKEAGEDKKPVIIQETYENNVKAAAGFLKAKKDYNLNIRAVFQWPNAFINPALQPLHWTKDYAPKYSAYLGGGQINAPDECIFKGNSKTCSADISWSSIYDNVCVFVQKNKEEKKLFVCGKEGTQAAPWITEDSFIFELRATSDPSSDLIDIHEIRGKKAYIKAVPEECKLDRPGPCTTQIFWNAPGGNVCVFARNLTKKDSKKFACGLKEFTREAPWITKDGAIFELREGSKSDSPLLDSVTVMGVK